MNVPARKPLRLWPGVMAAVLLCLARFVIPAVKPDAVFFGGIGGMVCALAILVWWLFFSRAPWSERIAVSFDDPRALRDAPSRSRIDHERHDGDDVPDLCHPGA